MTAYQRFADAVNLLPVPMVLELGTRRWGDNPTHHRDHFPDAVYTMSDFIDGDDVDVVSDAHFLAEFEDARFDAVLSYSTFEHIQYPWVAARAIHRVTKRGGYTYHSTHQTFPVHGYPSDYTRWTDQGLKAVFEWAGWDVKFARMFEPTTISRPDTYAVWDYTAPAYIGVEVFAVKP
jgi:SAM-dependent methyltransferase